MMDTLWQDIRFSFRALIKTPGATLVIVMTLAVAIDVNAVIFSGISSLLIRALPIREPDRMAFLWSSDPKRDNSRSPVSLADFVDWKAQSSSFENLAAMTGGTFNMTRSGEPVRLAAMRVTANLFATWGIEAIVGRIFRAEEDWPGAAPVVMLGHGFWGRQFGADPGVVGKSIVLDGTPHVVIGILGSKLELGLFKGVDVWTCLTLDPGRSNRSHRTLEVSGRLRQGVTLQQARNEIKGIVQRLAHTYPTTNADWGVRVQSTSDQLIGPGARVALTVLLAVLGFLLLIACTNVAHLTIARNIARENELLVRLALGADRWRIVRQLLTEGLMLSLTGGATGLILAAWGLVQKAVSSNPFIQDMSIDRNVFGFTLGLSIFAPLIFGLLPAVQSSSKDLFASLKSRRGRQSSGTERTMSRRLLLMGELVLALMSLIVATLMTKSAVAISQIRLGFAPERILTFRIDLQPSKYPEPQKIRAFYDDVLERIRHLPAVRSAAGVSLLPVADRETMAPLTLEGREMTTENERPWAAIAVVTPDYFEALQIPLQTGRYFKSSDSESSQRVVLISRTLAQRYWKEQEGYGARLKVVTPDADDRWLEVVGIVSDVRNSDVDAPLLAQIYVPHAQSPQRAMAIVVRTEAEPMSIVPAVRSAVRKVDPEQPIYDVRSMTQVIYDDLSDTYLLAGLFAVFSFVALTLGAAGIYGVTAHAVERRMHEFGVRMAFGAQARDLVRMVLTEHPLVILGGVAAGLAGGFGLARLISGLLYGVRPSDPRTFLEDSLLLAGVALLATYIPARRATRVDPMVALRYE